MEKAYWSLECA